MRVIGRNCSLHVLLLQREPLMLWASCSVHRSALWPQGTTGANHACHHHHIKWVPIHHDGVFEDPIEQIRNDKLHTQDAQGPPGCTGTRAVT